MSGESVDGLAAFRPRALLMMRAPAYGNDVELQNLRAAGLQDDAQTIDPGATPPESSNRSTVAQPAGNDGAPSPLPLPTVLRPCFICFPDIEVEPCRQQE